MDPQMIVEVAPVVELTATFFAFKRSFSCKIQSDYKQLATESRQPRFIAQIDILITSVLLSSKSRAARKKVKLCKLTIKGGEIFSPLELRPSYSRLRRTPLAQKLKKIRDCSQSITCVSSYMLLKRAKAREHFFTFSTLVRFILAVYWHMDFEVGGACKAPATFITFKRLLS